MKPPEVPFAANDPRWAGAFAKLGMAQALRDAGYAGLAEGVDEAGAASGGSLFGRARSRLRGA